MRRRLSPRPNHPNPHGAGQLADRHPIPEQSPRDTGRADSTTNPIPATVFPSSSRCPSPRGSAWTSRLGEALAGVVHFTAGRSGVPTHCPGRNGRVGTRTAVHRARSIPRERHRSRRRYLSVNLSFGPTLQWAKNRLGRARQEPGLAPSSRSTLCSGDDVPDVPRGEIAPGVGRAGALECGVQGVAESESAAEPVVRRGCR
jgi:hypothetical protein